MNTQEFESRMAALLPGLDPEAMKILVSYAVELDRDEIEQKEVFFKETYVEYYIANHHYGQELARQLFGMSKTFTLNPFEIRGAAKYLRDGLETEEISQKARDGLCDRFGQEWQESKDAMKAFEENRLEDYVAALEKTDKGAAVTWEMIAEKLDEELRGIKTHEQPDTDPALLSYFRIAAAYIHRHLKEYQIPSEMYEAVYKQDKILGQTAHHWLDEAVRRGGDTRDKADVAAISVDNWLAHVRQKEAMKEFEESWPDTSHGAAMSVKVKAYIRKDNGNMPDDYAGIVLPVTADGLYAALERLDFKPGDIDRCVIEGIAPKDVSADLMKRFPARLSLIAIDTLNYLASEIQNIAGDDLQQKNLSVIFEWAESGDGALIKPFPYPLNLDGGMDDFINVVLNMDKFTFVPSYENYVDLGLYRMMMKDAEIDRNPGETDEARDYEDYAIPAMDGVSGVFIDDDFIGGGDGFIPYMEMDNAIPEVYRVWSEAVSYFLPEDQRNKGYEYFRPNIDYPALVEGKTGIATLDLAAKIEDFCRAARIGNFNYDGSDIEARGQTIIMIASECENRNTAVVDMLDETLAARNEESGVKSTYRNLAAAFYSLDRELEAQIQGEFEGGHSGDDARLISGVITEYPESLRDDPGFLTLLVNMELHKQGIAVMLEQLDKSNRIDEPSPDALLFQILPSDMQVRLDLEHGLLHQLTQVKLAHENRIVALYDKEIAACVENRWQQKLTPPTIGREQAQKRQSVLEHLRELSDRIKAAPPRTHDKKNKDISL